MPKPPKNPESFDKVNYVIDAWSRPCDAPWYIYVETLKPALLEAFLTLIAFGWDDVLRGYARPRGLTRRTGKSKGKRRGFSPRRFPEFGDMVGRHLPGSDAVKGIKWSNGLKTLWRIDGLLQAGLFWWLVADVTEDFAFNWTSVLYETRWCQASSKGRFSWRKGVVEPISPNVWNEIGFTDKDYEFPNPIWIITFGLTGPNGATIAFSLDLEPFFPASPPVSFESRLVDTDTGEVYSTTGTELVDPDGKGIGILSAGVPNGRRFRVEVFAAGNWGKARDGVIIGMED